MSKELKSMEEVKEDFSLRPACQRLKRS